MDKNSKDYKDYLNKKLCWEEGTKVTITCIGESSYKIFVKHSNRSKVLDKLYSKGAKNPKGRTKQQIWIDIDDLYEKYANLIRARTQPKIKEEPLKEKKEEKKDIILGGEQKSIIFAE